MMRLEEVEEATFARQVLEEAAVYTRRRVRDVARREFTAECFMKVLAGERPTRWAGPYEAILTWQVPWVLYRRAGIREAVFFQDFVIGVVADEASRRR